MRQGQLPKIAQERLAAGAGLHSPAPNGTPAHLDSNLMAAFVERALVPAERTMVLQHLASCESCRAEISLVQKAGVSHRARPVPAERSIEQPWWRWMLGWEATAAVAAVALVVVAVSVSLRPAPHATSKAPVKAPVEIARNTPPVEASGSPPRNQPAAPQPKAIAVRASQPPSKSEALLKLGSANQESTGAEPLTLKAEYLARGAAKQSLMPQQAAPLPSPPRVTPASSGINAASAQITADAMKTSASAEAPQALVIQPNGAPVRALSLANAGQVNKTASLRSTALRSAEPGVRWAIAESAATGTVEQSLDGGRTWLDVIVATGVPLHAVFGLGPSVWAGGKAGALFHSSDGGQHWAAINVSSADGKLSADIIAIQFDDPAHGSVTGSNGERWTTSDGGANWQEKQ